MVPPIRYRLEIWDRTNSTRLAYAATVSELRRHRVLKGEETLAARITLHDYAAGRLQRGCVLRVQRVGEPQAFTLWRVTSVERSRTADGALACEISADALWTDLRHGRVRQLMADGRALYTWGLIDVAPEEWIRDVILPGYAGTGVTFELGVVELTAPVSLSFDRTSPLEALRMLEQACTEAEGGAELQFRPNALGTGYLVDLLRRVGQTDGGAELRYRKNIQALSRREDESAIATRVYAAGSGMLTLADAEWEIAAVGGTAAARVLSFKEAHPVFETGAFVGLWFYVPGKAAYPITASNAQAGTLTVTGTGRPALATGDVGWIATDQAGARLDYLESPAGVADYGVRVGDLVADDVPDALNLLPNGDFSDWANGLPVGWSAAGAPTIEESTDHAQRGGKAVHVTAAADGEGLVSDAVDVYQTDARPYTGMRVELTVISGQVRIELRHSNGTIYPVQQRPMSTGLGVRLELSANVHTEPLPEGTVQLAIVAHGGPAEWYLDAAMVTPIVADEVPAWVKRSGAWELWERAARHLAAARQPRLEYDVQVVDLHRVAPDLFRFDEIGLGDDVRLIDPDIARETVRVVEIEEELLTRGVERVVLAPSAELRLHDPYRPAPPGNRHGPVGLEAAGPAEVPRVLSVAAQVDPADGKLYLSPLGNARVATLELYLKTSRTASYPQTPAATLNGRQGTFPGQPLASARYFKVVPKDGRGVAGEAWEGGSESFTPTVGIRTVTTSNGIAADVYATPDSPIGEPLRVHVRDSDSASAPVWSLVQGSGNPTPRYVADATEIGPESWFSDGSSYAQKLKGISLLRDQIRRVYVQAEGQLTGLRSAWTAVPLELRAQPWLESVTAAWNDVGDSIEITAIGGAHCQSARYELSKDGFATAPAYQRDVSLSDNERKTEAFLIPESDRRASWRARVIPHNGPLTSGQASGLAGAPQETAVPPLPPETVLYTECRAWIVDSDATTVTIQVDATPAHAKVHLLGTVKLTRLSGPAPGVPAPSGTQWVFERPAFQAGEGQVVFRATAPGYESDDDHVVIPEQGRDTVPLTIRARVVSTTATTITVRVAVGDPVDPQRTGDATVSWQQVGTGGVSPASPQTIPAANIRTTPDASESAGGYRDFTITRPAPGAGAGRVTFTVTRAGRVQDLDAVDVPEQTPTVYRSTECLARIVSSTATQVTVQVTATAEGGGTPQVELVGVTGATLASGASPGTKVASGSTWVFNRPAFQAGAGQAQFRATLAGATSDDDLVVIPEQGRDTVALIMRAQVVSVTASQIVVRAYVADPQPGTGNVTVTAAAAGGSGTNVTPSSGTIPAGSVTSDLATTGYVDFTITRPAAGSGSGRVTFTATRSGRVPDVDAVDVPELPPTAVQIPPRALVRILEYTDLLDAVVQITGVAGEPTASPPTQYRWREYREGDTPGNYSDWLPLDTNRQATVTVARRPKGFLIVEAQVRTASGLESDPVTVRVAPTDGWQDDETGGPRWSFIVDDDGGQMALVNEASSKGQNLLGYEAGEERINVGGGIFYSETVHIPTAGLIPGVDVVSASMQAMTPDAPANRIMLRVAFLDAAQSTITSHFVHAQFGSYRRATLENLPIPANATWILYQVQNFDGIGTAHCRHRMLNRGPKALPFEQPPFRVGAGERIPKQSHLPQINTGNQNSAVRPIFGDVVLRSTYDHIKNTADILIIPFEVVYGFGTVVYNGNISPGIRGLAPGTTYHVYCDDPYYSGGAQTYVATTDPYEVLGGNGRLYVGTIVTATSSGSTGGWGGGGCIAVGSWMREGLRVEDLRPGDLIDVWVEGTDYDVQQVPVGIVAPPKRVPCVRLTSERGATLVVGWDTPITRRDGTSVPARWADGVECLVDVDGVLAWEPIRVEPAGIQDVILISVGGGAFAAGTLPNARIYTHNVLPIK